MRPRIMTATDTYLLLRAFCDELARCGMAHACTAPGSRCTPIVLSLVREPRLHCWSHLDERCAGVLRARGGQALRASGGGHLHLGYRGGQPGAGGDRGSPRARPADRVDRRPAARAARSGRRADDRSAQAVRRRGQMVLRGRPRNRHARVPALDPHPGLPRLLDGGARPSRARCISTSRCASRSCSTNPFPCPTTTPDATAARPYVTFDAAVEEVPSGGRHPFGRIVIVAGAERDATAGPGAGRLRGAGRDPVAGRPAVGIPARPGGHRPLRPAAARPGLRPRAPAAVRDPSG